jgi:hypothetical protein
VSRTIHAVQREVAEWSFTSAKNYADPFNEVELDVAFTGPGGVWRVPAFWAGGNEWRARFAPPEPGKYSYKTICSDTANPGLHGQEGAVEAAACRGDSPLLAHGAVQVAGDRRHLEHADGTPFLWLGDTWWMGLCERLRWPEDFQLLAADRAAKGFNVIQIVAGLYPDMPAFDPRGANEAGFPWEKDFSRVRPAYFDLADLRIAWLVRSGLVPCVVGCWGYFLNWMGLAKIKQHWRYLVARWGAYPVVWCLAGEGAMPYYLSKTREKDVADLRTGWTELGHYVRQVDPYHRLVTIHPTDRARDQVTDDSVLDFDMLQTGHGGRDSIPNTVAQVVQERERKPTMPVLVGEVNYEGLMLGNFPEIMRLAFWGSMLSGAAGHTYGANGLWQVNTRAKPYGPSPHGATWGDQPWEDAYRLPGSAHLGLAKRLLARYPWWKFEPHQEWIDPAAGKDDYFAPYAAGIPGQVRVIYLYRPRFPWDATCPTVKKIEPGVRYRAFYFDPRTGREHPLGTVEPGPEGTWPVPIQPVLEDWVLVLEKA